MLGFNLVLRHFGLIAIDKRAQADSKTGLVVDFELFDEYRGDI